VSFPPSPQPLDTVGTSSQDPPARPLPRRARRRLAREQAQRRRRTLGELAADQLARTRRRGAEARALLASYAALGEVERAGKVRACGRLPVYRCDVGGGGCGAEHARRVFRCGDRLCPWCAMYRGYRLAERLAPLVLGMANPQLLTLTVKNGPDLAERVAHLWRAFGRLRRRRPWRVRIAGGVALLEVTCSARTGWHPHLHLVVDAGAGVGAGELQRVLVGLWRAITRDSQVLDARPLTDVREAAKYCAKLADIVGAPARVREFVAALGGQRLVRAFGSCYGAAAAVAALVEDETPREEAAPLEACPRCGAVGALQPTGRCWARAEAAAVGGGWYARCDTVAAWAAVLAARAGPPTGRGGVGEG